MPGLSDRSLAKARRLLDDGGVREVTPVRRFVVQGDHGSHTVTVTADGATCTCSTYGACSHQEAAILSMGATRPSWPAAAGSGSRPRLSTWYFRAALKANPEGVVLIRISLGKPRWLNPRVAAAMPYIEELAPAGLFHVEDDAEFDRRYRDRLDGFGVELLERRFAEVAQANGGRPLVLLCFERDRRDCHRGMFAQWWLEQTGEIVPEFG